MHYSFSTVLMTILASNLIIILITLCFRYEKLMVSVGYRLLAVFLVLTLIRFLLPFELPFTKTIALPELLSKYIFYFQHPFFKIGFFKVSLWSVFECIWLIGIVVCLCRHIRTHTGSARYVAAFGRDITGEEPVQTILSEVCGKRKNPFRVTVIPSLDIPQIFGILSPRILIPEHIDLDSEEFRFSLHHEAYHYFHHDLLIKEAVNLLCILYWWNPACRRFQEQVGLILEMHVDDSLVNRDSDVARAYMSSLIHILESASDRQSSVLSDMTVAMASEKEEELTHRFQMLCRKNNKAHIPMLVLLLIIVASVYLCSYGIIFEAKYANEIESNDILFDTSTGFYAVLKEDGTYDLYYNGVFIENVESLEHYSDIPVFDED